MALRKRIAPDSHDVVSTKTSERLKKSLIRSSRSFSSRKEKAIDIKQEQYIIVETEIENEVIYYVMELYKITMLLAISIICRESYCPTKVIQHTERNLLIHKINKELQLIYNLITLLKFIIIQAYFSFCDVAFIEYSCTDFLFVK